ncbi:hypothetical protein DFS34DRAFT_637547 [Phlyctochytrium arcticum]|nr:hypothetical protein DFS34DRAFT_637547 [Phlyctochytrium arcticum]
MGTAMEAKTAQDAILEWAANSLVQLATIWIPAGGSSVLDKVEDLESKRIVQIIPSDRHSDLCPISYIPPLLNLPANSESGGEATWQLTTLHNSLVRFATRLLPCKAERDIRSFALASLRAALEKFHKTEEWKDTQAELCVIGSTYYGGALPESAMDLMIRTTRKLRKKEPEYLEAFVDWMQQPENTPPLIKAKDLLVDSQMEGVEYIQAETTVGQLDIKLYINLSTALKARDLMRNNTNKFKEVYFVLLMVIKRWFAYEVYRGDCLSPMNGFTISNMVLALVTRHKVMMTRPFPLPNLFLQFFNLYGPNFPTEKHAILSSVPEGLVVRRSGIKDKWHGLGADAEVSFLQVIDPCDTTNSMTTQCWSWPTIQKEMQDMALSIQERLVKPTPAPDEEYEMPKDVIWTSPHLIKRQRGYGEAWVREAPSAKAALKAYSASLVNSYVPAERSLPPAAESMDIDSVVPTPATNASAANETGSIATPATVVQNGQAAAVKSNSRSPSDFRSSAESFSSHQYIHRKGPASRDGYGDGYDSRRSDSVSRTYDTYDDPNGPRRGDWRREPARIIDRERDRSRSPGGRKFRRSPTPHDLPPRRRGPPVVGSTGSTNDRYR